MNTFVIFFSEKDGRDASSQLTPTWHGTQHHVTLTGWTHTHVGTKCINATLTRRVCSLSPALSRTCGLITECGSILEYVSIIILDTHQRIVDILRDYYTETLDMPVPAKVGHCAKRSFPRDEKSLSSIKIHQWNMIHKQDHKTRRRFPTLQTAQVSPSIPRTSCKHPRL